jgi:hypothetical protein
MVRMTLEPHPLQPGWRSLDSESFGFRVDDTIEATTLLTTFCGFHPLEMPTHPIGLFPAEKEDDPMWKDRVEHAKHVWALYPRHTAHLTIRFMSALYRLHALRGEAMSQLMGLVESTKITLDNREDLVVDLSTELVEKDLQVEQMANHIKELEDQVEARENTIEVLEDQLQNTQQQLRGPARTWWDHFLAMQPADHVVEWGEFKTAFRGHHIPAGIMDRKLNEFLALTKGSRAMLQYAQDFNDLCHYAGYHADTDKKKRDRFRRGINTKLHDSLNTVRAHIYNELVNLAISQEDCITARQAEKKRKIPIAGLAAQPQRFRIVSDTQSRGPQQQQGRWVIRPQQQ